MQLTRRDALAALAAAGAAGATGAVRSGHDPSLSDHEITTLVAVAEVAYPSDLSKIGPFVETYSVARVNDDPNYRTGVREALSALDGATIEWFGAAFADLDRSTRKKALRQVGALVSEPDPEGARGERIRYFVLNELLFALYTTPTGAKLVGLENPPGYPGGDTSYRRGPPSDRGSNG